MSKRIDNKSIKQRATVLSGLLAIVLACAPLTYTQKRARALPESVGLSSTRLDRLTVALNDYVKNGKLSGGVALVARRGKVVYVNAFGQSDRETKSPMREDAIFRVASQSKALVSVAVMILQEEGRLLISDPVGILPESCRPRSLFAKDGGDYEVVKAKRPITIRDLLTHTSGVSYGGGAGP